MKRKLVRQGSATMMVSLPAKWIKQHQLDKGDEIEITEDNQDLRIHTSKNNKLKKAKIDLTGFHPLMNRVVLAYYIKGVDEIEVTFSNPNESKHFRQRTVDELLGFEIIKQTKDTILIKDVTGAEKQDIDEIIQRIFFILEGMVEEIHEGDTSGIAEMDLTVNKFAYFCHRILNTKGYKDPNKTKQFYAIVSVLEYIGDLYKKWTNNIKLTKKHKENVLITKDLLILCKKSMFNFNKETVVAFANKYKDINKIEDPILQQIADSIIRINNYILDMNLEINEN